MRTDQIGAYIGELTPMTLRYDTRVTNNGFVNGNPDNSLGFGFLVSIDGEVR